MAYQILDNRHLRRLADGAIIPTDVQNAEYQEFLRWQAAGNTPTPADPTPPAPPTPDFGADLPADYVMQVADAVAQLRAYLALASPTAGQSAGALKILIKLVLFLLRRVAL